MRPRPYLGQQDEENFKRRIASIHPFEKIHHNIGCLILIKRKLICDETGVIIPPGFVGKVIKISTLYPTRQRWRTETIAAADNLTTPALVQQYWSLKKAKVKVQVENEVFDIILEESDIEVFD